MIDNEGREEGRETIYKSARATSQPQHDPEFQQDYEREKSGAEENEREGMIALYNTIKLLNSPLKYNTQSA